MSTDEFITELFCGVDDEMLDVVKTGQAHLYPSEVLLSILARDIQDGRLLNLIRLGLEAGYVEEWTYHKTYSGTPQGGILSPILANIYMHKLDEYVEDVLMPHYTRGKKWATNLAYKRYEWPIKQAREHGNSALAYQLERERRQLARLRCQRPELPPPELCAVCG